MQREILFKAKSTDTGKWEEGLPNYCSTDGSVTKMVSYSPGSFKVFSIEPKTLCQYTTIFARKKLTRYLDGSMKDIRTMQPEPCHLQHMI